MKKYFALGFLVLFVAVAGLYSQASSGDFKTITVQPGENLDKIATKYLKSIKFKNDLLRYNKMTAGDVKPGKKIKVPYSISKERSARIKFLKGNVQRNEGKGWHSVSRVGTILLQQDKLKTGGNGRVEVQFDDGSLLQLTSNSSISLKEYSYSRKGRKANVNLKKGAIFANVNKLRRNSNFKVSTATAVAGVRGTQFYVSIDKKENVKLEVYKGGVDISANNKKVSVKAGQETIVKKGSAPTDPTKIKSKRRVRWSR